MGWLEELGEGAKEFVTETVPEAVDEFVTETIPDKADDARDFAVEQWDRLNDWVTGEDAPVTDLEGAPTKDQIWDALDTIRPILLEGYSRQEAHDRYGHYPALTPNSSVALSEFGGGYVHGEGPSHWDTIAGFYRYSETLGFMMPAAIPDEVAEAYQNGKDFQATWVGSTVSDDEDIHNTAMASVIVEMANIEEGYRELLAQCDLSAMADLLPKINAVCVAAEAIHETHSDREAVEIKEAWAEWEASEVMSDSLQYFGSQLKVAFAEVWGGAGVLAYSASQEATLQAHAMVLAYNNIAETWELILEKLNSSTAREQAASKFIASLVINRIPFAGDTIATHDFVLESATNGEVESPASNFFNGIIDRLTGKDVPDGDTCAEVVKMLSEGIEDCIEGLTEGRRSYVTDDLVESVAEKWEAYLTGGVAWQIIPGYLA